MSDRISDFDGLRVVFFESRRSTEMAELVRRRGGESLPAPSMREVPREDHPEAVEFARRLAAGEIEVVILLTGVGTRTLVDAVAPVLSREALVRALGSVTTVCRGPKPVAALRELELRPAVTVPEPNTWRDVLDTIDRKLDVRGLRVAVQEYGEENPDLTDGLRSRGAEVVRVPIYRWELPEDLGPLRDAIRATLHGRVDVALFTSATQVRHVFRVAGPEATTLADAFSRIVVASIGPVCSEALRRYGLEPDLEPEHPRMGHLVREAAARSQEILERKRPGSDSGM